MSRLPKSRASQRLDQASNDSWQAHLDGVERLERGEDVILLSVGDPDFPTPEFITQKVLESLETHRTHYSPAAGEPKLRAAIASLESSLTGKSLTSDQFVIYPGATAALFAIVMCIADEGDEIVVPEPMYVGYRDILDAVGLNVRTVALSQPEFGLDVDQVEAAITEKTRAVLVNTPGNPCGNIIPAQSLKRLNDICRDRNIWLICDEVYSLIYFDEPHVSLLRCADSLDHAVVVDGLSKSHAMSGWRVGWVCAPRELADALEHFAGAALFGCSQFIQDAAAYALTHDEPQVAQMRAEYQRRRDYAVRRIRTIPGLACSSPKAGMFVMMDVSAVARDGDDFARMLLDCGGVSTVSGSGFGSSTTRYVRVSLTQDLATLKRAFDRVERVVKGE